MPKKIAINTCYGGFNFSNKAWDLYEKLTLSITNKNRYGTFLKRDDPAVIKIIEELKEEANGPYSDLSIVEIPDDVEWQIEDYDGVEWVAEKHRTWGKESDDW